jgi:glutathione S-transferase
MLTIYGVPLSVHTRKVILAARLKGLDYQIEPVVPYDPPAGWRELSPTGLIPVLRDGDLTLADSSVICTYLDRTYLQVPIYPADTADNVQALWLEAYGGWQLFHHAVHPLFFQQVIGPKLLQQPTDQAAVAAVLEGALPQHLGYLEGQATGGWLAGDAVSIADIAVASNLLNLAYLGHRLDHGRYPRLAGWFARTLALPAVRQALAAERPFAERMGLDTALLP